MARAPRHSWIQQMRERVSVPDAADDSEKLPERTSFPEEESLRRACAAELGAQESLQRARRELEPRRASASDAADECWMQQVLEKASVPRAADASETCQMHPVAQPAEKTVKPKMEERKSHKLFSGVFCKEENEVNNCFQRDANCNSDRDICDEGPDVVQKHTADVQGYVGGSSEKTTAVPAWTAMSPAEQPCAGTTAVPDWKKRLQSPVEQPCAGTTAVPDWKTVHGLLNTAIPKWTEHELQGAKDKLGQIGIVSYSHVEDALREKGVLNQRFRDKGLKAFANPTLDRLRSVVNNERERMRQARALAESRERDRVEEERRRLDQENKASMVPPASLLRSIDPPRELDQEKSEVSVESEVSPLGSTDAGRELAADRACLPKGFQVSDADGFVSSEAELPIAGPAKTQSDTAAPDREAKPVEAVAPASNTIGSGVPRGSSGARCWEWPLTREEKKQRITILDRQVLSSYKRELEELQARASMRPHRMSYSAGQSSADEDDPDPGSSQHGDPEWNSEFGVYVAG